MKNLIFMSCFIIFSILTAVSMIVTGIVFSYKSFEETKSSTYECGLSVTTPANLKLNIQYFFYLIMFLIFDVCSIFLYPLLIIETNSINNYGCILLYISLILTAMITFIKLWSHHELCNNNN